MAVPEGKYILIVEDDPDQSEFIAKHLRRRFPRHAVEVVETESAFRERFAEFSLQPPAVAIIDIILRWSDPDHIPPRPPEVDAGGFQEAGLRCEQLLRDDPHTAQVPVILYTVTARDRWAEELNAANEDRRKRGLPEIDFLTKEPDIEPLLAVLRNRLS